MKLLYDDPIHTELAYHALKQHICGHAYNTKWKFCINPFTNNYFIKVWSDLTFISFRPAR